MAKRVVMTKKRLSQEGFSERTKRIKIKKRCLFLMLEDTRQQILCLVACLLKGDSRRNLSSGLNISRKVSPRNSL
jgi:hypothetical protein